MRSIPTYASVLALTLTLLPGCADFLEENFTQHDTDGGAGDDDESRPPARTSELVWLMAQSRYYITYTYQNGDCGYRLDETQVGFGTDPIAYLESTTCRDLSLEQRSRNTLYLRRQCVEEDGFGTPIRTAHSEGLIEVVNERFDIQGRLTIRIEHEFAGSCEGQYSIQGIRETPPDGELTTWQIQHP